MSVFEKLDKIKPVYDIMEKILMFICKILLAVDIVIAIYSVLARYGSVLVHNYEALSFLQFISNSAWSEEVVLSCMAYMAVLSAALALRHGSHIKMDVFDRFLSKKLVCVLDLIADAGLMYLAFVMLIVGWQFTTTLGAAGTYVSMPWLSRFWMYLPVPVAGFFMIVFELEAIYNHIKKLCGIDTDEKKEAEA